MNRERPTCRQCGGRLVRVDDYLETRNGRRRPMRIHNFRCRGECRGGGFVAERQRDGSVSHEGGPVFKPAGRTPKTAVEVAHAD